MSFNDYKKEKEDKEIEELSRQSEQLERDSFKSDFDYFLHMKKKQD